MAAPLLMEDDPYVSYHLDEATGIPYFCWSAIEHVFAEDHEIDSLQERLMNKENTPAKPIMLVEDLARMRGQDPIDWRLDGGDLSDEMLENLARHDGPILLLEGATAPPVYQQVALKRILDEAGPERVLKLDWSRAPG